MFQAITPRSAVAKQSRVKTEYTGYRPWAAKSQPRAYLYNVTNVTISVCKNPNFALIIYFKPR